MNYKYMKIRINQLILLFVLILSTVNSVAQELVSLPQDAAIKKGSLPCGLNYYVVNNSIETDHADFALVQKILPGQEVENLLESSNRFPDGSIKKFLMRYWISYGEDGYEIPNEFSRIYDFRNVMVDSVPLDSLILACMDIAERSSASFKDQAVIISGDVNPDSIISSLKMMSYMYMPSEYEPIEDYVGIWDSLGVRKGTYCKTESTSEWDVVEIVFSEPRMDQEHVATILPVVSERMAEELELQIRSRLEYLLEREKIPYAYLDIDHITGESTLMDNEFHIKVKTSPGNARKLKEMMFYVLDGVDSGNIGVDEFNLYRNMIASIEKKKSVPLYKTNDKCVRMCINSFLYGASLATDATEVDFIERRVLPDTTRLRLFRDFADGVIALDSIECVLQDSSDLTFPMDITYSLSSLPGPGHKAKATKKEEPLSKAQQWIFPNGFKVVYIRKNTDGKIFYDLSMNGGLSVVKNLKRGEAAFIEDQMFLSRIGEYEGRRFRDLLLSRGITMVPEVRCPDFTLRGEAPAKELKTLMGALLYVSNERTGDRQAFDYYLECERLRLKDSPSRQKRISAIDSIICNTNIYSLKKNLGALSPDIFDLSEMFYGGHFRKMNDGILVLVGDEHEDKILAQVQHFAGRFRRQPRIPKKSYEEYRPIAGTATYTVNSDVNSVDIACTALQQYTAVNHAAAEVLELALEDALSKALDGSGYYATVSVDLVSTPREYLGLMVMADEVSPDANLGEEYKSPYEVLHLMNSVLSDFKMSKDMLKMYKSILKDRDTSRRSSPEYWPEEITRRYSEGKDITTKYKERIYSVTSELVDQMLQSLLDGGKVEYINLK